MAKRKAKGRELTPKQLKFIQFYSGNGTDAARLAGYSGTDNALGVIAYKLLRNAKIRAAIKRRGDIEIEPLIMNRMARQMLWSKVATSPMTAMKDRLKASELLGKSEGDFIDVVKVAEPIKHEVIVVSEEQVKAVMDELDKEY